MTRLQDTINDIAKDLHDNNIIDKTTLRYLTGDDLPVLLEYTGEEIQQLRKNRTWSICICYIS